MFNTKGLSVGLLVSAVIGFVVFLKVVVALAPTATNASADFGNSGLPLASTFGGASGLIILLFGVAVVLAVIGIFGYGGGKK